MSRRLENYRLWLSFFVLLTILFMLFIAGAGKGQDLIDKSGHPHAKRQGRTQKPKILIDTLRMDNGFGILALSKTFKKNKMTTAPTDPSRIYPKGVTQILSDTSQTVNYYAFAVNRTGDTIFVKSNNANDSSLVTVEFMIK